eukprot:gene5840-11159_t
MQSLFYHNHSEEHAFTNNLNTKSVRNAITLHPVKKAPYMYRLHVHFIKLKIQDLLHETVLEQRRLRVLDKLLAKNASSFAVDELAMLNDIRDFGHKMPKDQSPDWDMFTARKIYSYSHDSPEIGMINPTRDGLNQVLGQTMMIVNKEARKVLHRTLEFKRLNHGYKRHHPVHGSQYMLDLLMKYHRHIGYNRRRMTVHVRHHAYLQHPFGNLVYMVEPAKSSVPVIHFLLPLAGRLGPFTRFMKTFEEICLRAKQPVKLLILYFKDVSPGTEQYAIVKSYLKRYPGADIRWINMKGAFSRSLALSMGASQFSKTSLLFFCDVDLDFNSVFLDRCRNNAIEGQQVYYPIVFSQYNQELAFRNTTMPKTSFFYGRNAGFWRLYAFGIACMYRFDLMAIGGFDTTIQGWGLEDVELYERFVSSNAYDVFRAIEPGLVHVYHDITCAKDLPEKQLKMCFNSKAGTYGSQKKLYEIILDKGYLT